MDDAAVGEGSYEMDVGERGRKDAAADGEDFAADTHGFGKIARNMGQCGQKQIAKIVADQAATCLEAVLKKAAEKGLVLRECDHAVADIAGRQDTIFTAETPGASAVIGYGDDGGEIDNAALGVGTAFMTAEDVFFETPQKSG